MILSQRAQTVVKAVRAIPDTQLDQNKIKVQVRQNIETGEEIIVICVQDNNTKERII